MPDIKTRKLVYTVYKYRLTFGSALARSHAPTAHLAVTKFSTQEKIYA